jgi:hypothetical protein
MSDVNEEILEQYLKVVKQWFYIGDIPFIVPHNYSNVDVLGYDPKNNKYYDFEVKYRSAFSLTNNGKDIYYLVNQFSKHKDSRDKKLREYIGRRKATKVVVTTYTMMGKTIKKRSNMEKDFKSAMKKEGFSSQVWYFDEMIPQLVEYVNKAGRYNTQLLQTIRMLKTYGVT